MSEIDKAPGLEFESLHPRLQRAWRTSLIVGLVATAALVAGLLLAGPGPFFRAYLVAFLFWLSISLGSLGMGMLHYLVGGDWGYLIRRVLEASYKALWAMALLFIPLIFGLQHLYPWARPELVAEDALLQHKAPYLNIPFFVGRAALYFAVWLALAWVLSRWAPNPAYTTDPVLRRRLQRISALGILAYGLTMTFASFDWIMSLQPEWQSTVFGMLIVTGQALAGIGFALLFLPLLARLRPLDEIVTPRLIRDLGAIVFSAVIFWAYIAYSQYLVIWAGNIPREALWYIYRGVGGWLWVGLAAFAIQFALPFLVLLPVSTKRNPRVLIGLAALMLVARFLDYYWHVMPAFSPGVLQVHWLDLAAPVALGGLWLAAFFWHLIRTPQPVVPQLLRGQAGEGRVTT